MQEMTSRSSPTLPLVAEKVRAVMIAIKQQWPHTQIDMDDPAGVWSNAIDPLRIDQVRYGINRLASNTSDFAPTPAQFAAHAKAAPDPVERKPKLPAKGEKQAAKDALNWAYAMRIFQGLGMSLSITKPKYTGDFNFQSIADGAVLPPADDQFHKPYWQKVWDRFEQEWGSYVR